VIAQPVNKILRVLKRRMYSADAPEEVHQWKPGRPRHALPGFGKRRAGAESLSGITLSFTLCGPSMPRLPVDLGELRCDRQHREQMARKDGGC
jgi:hypothetical protein